jgi:hypothetical protein
MTAGEFLLALNRCGFTQVAFARQFGLSDRQIRRWANGEWPVPPYISALLQLMVKHKTKPEDLKI